MANGIIDGRHESAIFIEEDISSLPEPVKRISILADISASPSGYMEITPRCHFFLPKDKAN
jgi:hypothetical protein